MKRKEIDQILDFKYVAITQGNNYLDSFNNEIAYSNNKTTISKIDDISLNQIQKKIYGYLTYDLKNEVENLTSENPDFSNFDTIFFFEPKNVVNSTLNNITPNCIDKVNFKSNWTKEEYIECVKKIQQHIIDGDVYELNLCMEFYAEKITINPFDIYLKLNQLSPNPFSCFIKNDNQFIICASPERFLKKDKNTIISQPIKGTAKRHNITQDDLDSKEKLLNSEKERAENLMIVDLVRNDLAKSAVPGSVKVEELFGIYMFPQVFQMISTISAEVTENTQLCKLIKDTFPMGSMTGAPKIKSMKLIEKYEKSKRGVFSGAIGSIDSNGNFDFNVVIRSLFYNSKTEKLSFQVGSAITIDSNPEEEYNECLLKAQAIFKCFE